MPCVREIVVGGYKARPGMIMEATSVSDSTTGSSVLGGVLALSIGLAQWSVGRVRDTYGGVVLLYRTHLANAVHGVRDGRANFIVLEE